ncbi:RNA exonuclease 4 [Moelleriella libera RCEF 2490]|uniref:RNA exonuclease 4 n=1 Tax=Moelleriella libera RCEF 2490 TaxID=1081109 RepID=A0A166VJ06_9HYPO|nr:RNA exonuclease 4 [Moelleriella libera RCEF 2490]
MDELSSNWKKLQAKLTAAASSSSSPSASSPSRGPKSSLCGKRNETLLSRQPTGIKKNKKKSAPASQRLSHHRVKTLPGGGGGGGRGAAASSQVNMGGVHSSEMETEATTATATATATRTTRADQDKRSNPPAAAAHVWMKNGGQAASSEALAEAYGLGLRDNSMMLNSHTDRVNHGLSLDDVAVVGKYVALDCEMVGVGPGGHESALARVSVVDFHGRQIYDSYVRPRERVTDWRTSVSGVSAREMRFSRDFQDVQADVAKILKGRILVGHDVKHDLDALKLDHPAKDVRDTAKHRAFRKHGHGRKPALRNLARELLGVQIQEGAHSSTEDARVTMLLFRKFKPAFDVDHANRYVPRKPTAAQSKRKKH